MKQYYFWDEQPNWEPRDIDDAIEQFRSGKSIKEIAESLNRSPIGVYAKLQSVQRNTSLGRELDDPETFDAPFLIQLVYKCEKIID